MSAEIGVRTRDNPPLTLPQIYSINAIDKKALLELGCAADDPIFKDKQRPLNSAGEEYQQQKTHPLSQDPRMSQADQNIVTIPTDNPNKAAELQNKLALEHKQKLERVYGQSSAPRNTIY